MTTGAGTTLRTSLAAMLLAVATVLFTAALPVTARGEAPRYEPYGAWRGRIRYVEGPRRTRTHIRWGNGITPVGGQVLMHFATVAGNVATNENFLNAVAPGLRNAEVDADLVAAVNGLGESNTKLVDELNKVRKSVGLGDVVLTAASPATTPPPNGAPSGNLEHLVSQYQSLTTAFNKNRSDLAAQILHTAATADDTVAASEAQKTKLAALKAFAGKDFMKGIDAPMPVRPPTTAAGFDESIKSINELKTATLGVLKDLLNVDNQLLTADPTADPDSIKNLQAEIAALKQYLADLEALNL